MSNYKVASLSELRTYIRERLGIGVINVELTQQQLDNAIYDSIHDFTRYCYGEGVHRHFVGINIQKDVYQYDLSQTEIEDVVDITIGTYYGDINQVFSPANLVFQGKFNLFSLDMSGFYSSMMYMKTVDELLGLHYTGFYNSNTKMLTIIPTPKTDITALMVVHKNELEFNLYNHVLVKKLAVAYAKQTWKMILGKNGGFALPGGGQITAEFLGDPLTEINEIIQEIKDESAPPMFGMY